jgi:peptidoglycan/xylan/chitin deacetylase (PgdA/CDA1 family)
MSVLRNFAFKTLYNSGVGNLLLASNRKKGKIPVLVFHRIIPHYDPIWPGIHPRIFEEMIVLLKKKYQLLPLSDLYDKGKDLRNACFITFDDGYKDYLEYAYPLLKKHAVPSALFVLPSDLSNQGHIWTATINYFVRHYSYEEVKLFLDKHDCVLDIHPRMNKFALNLHITRYLCQFTQKERKVVLEDLQRKLEADSRILDKELLTMEELRKLDPAFVSIASHSLTHPSFKLETDKEFIEHELKESKNILETSLKVKVEAFAFPFAKFNSSSINEAKKHYRLCFTGINDFVYLDKLRKDEDSIYNLSRFNVHHDTAEEVFFLINGFHKKLSRL